ncbi:MAG: hypothetical protein F4X83_00280 [Chloroflexi bacterium]|nr:hypothetical protein [Chloroflexota bacterium]
MGERVKQPETIEEVRTLLAERLQEVVEPDSNERLLVSQTELARHDKLKALLQSRLYGQLLWTLEENQDQVHPEANQLIRHLSTSYLPIAAEFYASMEKYWEDRANHTPGGESSWELFVTRPNNAHSDEVGSGLLLTSRWGLRPVCLLMNPYEIAHNITTCPDGIDGYLNSRVDEAKMGEQRIGILKDICEEFEHEHGQIYVKPLNHMEQYYRQSLSFWLTWR